MIGIVRSPFHYLTSHILYSPTHLPFPTSRLCTWYRTNQPTNTVWLVMKEEQEKARKAYAKADAEKQRIAREELEARQAEMRKDIEQGS